MKKPGIARYLFHYLRQVRGRFALSFVLLLLIASLTAVKAWIIQPVVDGFLAGDTTNQDLTILCLLVAGIFLSQATFNWLYAVVARSASAKVVQSLRTDLFGHLTRQSLGYFVDRPSADLVSRVVNDVGAFENAAVGSIQVLMRDLLTIALLLAVLFLKDWRLALSCLGILAVAGWILRSMSTRIKGLARTLQETVSNLNRRLAEMIGGIELILGFGLENRWQDRFREVTRDHYRMQLKTTRTGAAAVFVVLVMAGLTLSTILFITGRALLRGEISSGEFGTFLAAMYLIQSPALTIGNSVSNLSRGLAAVGRSLEILEDAPAVTDPDVPEYLTDEELEIQFDTVSFSYRSDASVVGDLSFAVQPGELVVMVGDSGAGKSTVAKLLMRFYDPDGGQVKIGKTSVHQLDRKDLYSKVSYVSQDVYLFDGSLEFNLKIGRPHCSEAELDEAIRIACVDAFLAELPDGLATHVGERGTKLSGGQRQRVSIARAVLRDTSILVLDEATSALDMELEQRILQNLVDARRARTIFAITHRLSLAEIADRVLVLKDGYLAEQGSASTLATQNGEFARLQAAAKAKLVRHGNRSPVPVSPERASV